MKFIQKLYFISIRLFFVIILIHLFLNNLSIQQNINQLIDDWLKIVVPSISISYISSSFIYHYPLISIILYPILKPIFNFENQKSCSLYLISIIIGQPSSTKLIINAEKNNEISIYEANRLMQFANFISPIFLIKILGNTLGIISIIIELISSLIISFFSKSQYLSNFKLPKKNLLDIYFNIIDDLPKLLLGILTSMIIISIFNSLFNQYIISNFLEITSGLKNLIYLSNSIWKFILIQLLISIGGIAIILQIYWIIKKTNISMLNFIKYRLVSIIITTICSLIIYLIIFFI